MTTKKMDPGYKLYGSQLIMRLAADLAGEGEGVKAAGDIEYIHRMRVASRRLRAALPLFSNCFPEKEYKRWEREVKLITKSLGRARDLDVQIAFLREYESKLSNTALPFGTPRFLPEEYQTKLYSPIPRKALPAAPEEKPEVTQKPNLTQRIITFFTGTKPDLKSSKQEVLVEEKNFEPEENQGERYGVECLILRLMQERAAIQPEVIKAVERFENEKIIESINKHCMETVILGKIDDLDPKTRFSYQEAYYHITLALETLFLYEKALMDPERISAHHEMRIAAKKLRYTMEAYKDLYGDGLSHSIKMVKELQDYLGEIHDCDVWTESLPVFLKEEQKRSLEYFGNASFMNKITPGIFALEKNRAEKRGKLHENAVSFWEKSGGGFEKLEKNIAKPFHDFRFRTLTIPEHTKSITFLGDIHGNLPALKAAVTDAKLKGVEMFLYVGDMIGFGPYPKETLECLDSVNASGVLGNIEETIMSVGSLEKRPRNIDEKRFSSHKKTWKRLTSAQKAKLAAEPVELRFTWGDKRFAIMHRPKFPENVCLETSDADLERLVQETDADVIICAHTHRRFVKDVHGTFVINTGSVGRSGDADLRACYLLLTKDPFEIHHILLSYDQTLVLEKLKKQKSARHLRAMFACGLDFDEAVMAEKTGEFPPKVMPEITTVETFEHTRT